MNFTEMNIGERLKYLRKEILHLSQKEFGDKIGVSDATISKIEKNLAPLTERNIKSICREFNVSIAWIKEGLGDIFIDLDNTLIDEIADEYNLDDIQKNIVKTYLELDDEDKDVLTNFLLKALRK